LNEWLGQIKSATSPALIPDLAAFTEAGKTVVSIHISEFPVKPVNTRGRYFKRVASSNHAAAYQGFLAKDPQVAKKQMRLLASLGLNKRVHE
jgi:predicted HTH transcriptional regulator